jgi:hypothetical protein
MNKATLTEAVILIASGALAGGLAKTLNDHNVGTAPIVAVIVFTLATGQYFAAQIVQGMRTSYFACPTKGCTVSIRARGTNTHELTRLQALATDHSKHGSNR